MLAMTWYQWFTGLHTLAAVVWVGGGAMLVLNAILAERARDPADLARTLARIGKIGNKVLTPAAVAALAFGFALVENGDWSYSEFFVAWGLAAWGLSFVTGAFFLGPEAGRLGKVLSERPPDDPEALMRMKRILTIARVDEVILLGTVLVMGVKPFL